MPKTAIEAPRKGSNFSIGASDPRVKLITDEKHPLYDPRVKLPISEKLAFSLARGGQTKPIQIRVNGEDWEIVDGRQEVKAARWFDELIDANDPRVAFRAGKKIELDATVIKSIDAKDLVRRVFRSNAHIGEPTQITAERIQHGLNFGLDYAEIATEMGISEATVRETYDLIASLSPTVAPLVGTKDGISKDVAREMVKGGQGKRLNHDQQNMAVADLKARGQTKGAGAKAIIRGHKKGKTVETHETQKMRGRDYLIRFREELVAGRAQKAIDVQVGIAIIDHLLRVPKAFKMQPRLATIAARLEDKTTK